MPRPAESSIPQLAAGCRLSAEGNTLLVPEGAIRLHGPARHIIECCDGQRSFGDIVRALQQQFTGGDPTRIERDTAAFLERLHERRVVNF
jgi:coenzyme PQQ biosynthesis protein PqqD